MKRRDFVRHGTFAAAGLGVAGNSNLLHGVIVPTTMGRGIDQDRDSLASAALNAAQAAGADYVAFGSFFASSIKPGAVRANPDLLRQAKRELHVPVTAIGGITADNGNLLVAAGADHLAVISAVFGQSDVERAARDIGRLFPN